MPREKTCFSANNMEETKIILEMLINQKMTEKIKHLVDVKNNISSIKKDCKVLQYDKMQ